MSRTFIACTFIAFAWMGLFFLWGRAFLTAIKAKVDIASSIAFGYLVLQVIYQVIYLPFYLNRGSFKGTAYIWMGLVGLISLFLYVYLRRHSHRGGEKLKAIHKIGICGGVILILGLAFYISLHVPFYGQDTVEYISTMNAAYYNDSMWVKSGELSLHHGLCSMFHFFTISSLLTGIKPYYISLFTVRIVGVSLFSFILYRTGVIVFQKEKQTFCWSAAILAIVAPTLLMFWGSNYTAEFFYWRINEAKGYCQFVLLPLGFSVFLSMFRGIESRKPLWKEQLIVGLAAVPISSSSMTPYIFLVLMGTGGLIANDIFKNGWNTIKQAVACVAPNLIYLALYILEQKQLLAF